MVETEKMVRPISDRIQRIRARFKSVEYGQMYCCAERTKILTEAYKKYEADYPLIKRAKFFRDLCQQMTVLVEDEELIVGNQGTSYRAVSPYVDWYEQGLFDSVCGDDETFRITWQTDGCRQRMTDEDREHFRSVADFWKNKSLAARASAVMPDSMICANLAVLISAA